MKNNKKLYPQYEMLTDEYSEDVCAVACFDLQTGKEYSKVFTGLWFGSELYDIPIQTKTADYTMMIYRHGENYLVQSIDFGYIQDDYRD